MFDPKKRLGADDESDGRKKPSVTVAFGFKPGRRLGDEGDDGEGDESEPDGDLETQAEQAAEGMCRLFNINSSKAKQLRSYLETIFVAADAKPHSEGEHTDEEED